MTEEEINELCKGNFNKKNIEDISRQIEKEYKNNPDQKKVLRMINNSSVPCNVNITEQSRKKCAQSIIN